MRGPWVLPGLIDAHVHVYAVELDTTRAMRRPFSYLVVKDGEIFRNTVD